MSCPTQIPHTPVSRAAVLLSITVTAAASVLVLSGRPLMVVPGSGEVSLMDIHLWAGWLAGAGLVVAFGSAVAAYFCRCVPAILALWTGWALATIGLVTAFWFLVGDLMALRHALLDPGSTVPPEEADRILGSLQVLPAATTLVALLAVVPPAVWVAGPGLTVAGRNGRQDKDATG